MTGADDGSSSVGSQAVRKAAWGTLQAVLLKMLSFGLNQVTVRLVSPSTLGLASIQLELLLSTTLFVGREGFRLALTGAPAEAGGKDSQNSKGDGNEDERRLNNVMWLSVPAGITAAILALVVHIWTASSSSEASGDYMLAGILYCGAALIESLAEPLVIVCMRRLDTTSRASAEAAASLVKAATTVFLLMSTSDTIWWSLAVRWPVTAFGVAQLMYAISLCCILYRRLYSSVAWPSWHGNGGEGGDGGVVQRHLDLATVRLAFFFTGQSLFKHALTEGDRIVLTFLSNSYDKGVYAMASAYGGMASRLLLQPVEENGRLLFGRHHGLLVAEMAHSRTKAPDQKGTSKEGSATARVQQLQNEFETSYCGLLKLVLYVGLVFAAFATNYAGLGLRVLAGRRWLSSGEDAIHTLEGFCVYTAVLALNGTTEAFVYATASSGAEVRELSVVHGILGALFAILAPLLIEFAHLGNIGLLLANGICMMLRSVYSLRYAIQYFGKARSAQSSESNATSRASLGGRIVPPLPVLLAFLISFVLTNFSKMEYARATRNLESISDVRWMRAAGQHLAIGMSCAIGVVTFSLWLEKGALALLQSFIARRRRPKEKHE